MGGTLLRVFLSTPVFRRTNLLQHQWVGPQTMARATVFETALQLPSTSFERFDAFRVNQFHPLWIAKGEQDLAVDQYAVALPVAPDFNRAFLSRTRVPCEAERYGGRGLGANGGGARCGNLQGLQIKGVGANPLAAKTNDYFHSYGGMGLAEGILEAIWGEILAVALPHGASQTKFIIGLPDFVPVRYPVSGGPQKTRRILTGRIPILRLAHFMRAVGFHPPTPLAGCSDAERTKAALQALPSLISPSATAPQRNKIEDSYFQALVHFLERLAVQIATARALRIMHGSITESNVGINGEWLDFASVSALSGYGRIILPRGAPNFLNEEDLIRNGLIDICFYINKFVFGRKLVIDAKILDKLFMNALATCLQRQWVKLTGLRDADLDAMPTELHNRLSNAISAVALHGATSSFTILSTDNNERVEMPTKLASFDLNNCLSRCAWLNDFESIQKEIAKEVDTPSLRDNLAHALTAAKTFHLNRFSAEGHSENASAARRAVLAFDCLRFNLRAVPLYRTNLYPAVDNLARAASAEEVSTFINRNVELGIKLLSKAERGVRIPVGNDRVETVGEAVHLNGEPVAAEQARAVVDAAMAALKAESQRTVL
jgi:hypothetical protein